jgi:hypothetical protein
MSAAVLLPLMGGCEAEIVPAGGPAAVAVEPGYYYDEAYVGVDGVYHPRTYWYHDGHAWAHRDALPAGFHARDRAAFGYARGDAPHGGDFEHGGDGDHGGRR